MQESADKWNRRYRDAELPGSSEACEVLRRNRHLLPETGKALDLACGLGTNALLLAEQGLAVEAWDIAETALTRLAAHAEQQGLAIHTEVRDVEANWPVPGSFDVICVSRFLYRPMLPALAAALRPGGLLFYQTFNREKPSGKGPDNPDFLLTDDELLRAFPQLTIRFYQALGQTGDTATGNRHETLFVGQSTN